MVFRLNWSKWINVGSVNNLITKSNPATATDYCSIVTRVCAHFSAPAESGDVGAAALPDEGGDPGVQRPRVAAPSGLHRAGGGEHLLTEAGVDPQAESGTDEEAGSAV